MKKIILTILVMSLVLPVSIAVALCIPVKYTAEGQIFGPAYVGPCNQTPPVTHSTVPTATLPTNTTASTQQIVPVTTEQTQQSQTTVIPVAQTTTTAQDNSAKILALQKQINQLLQQLVALLKLESSLQAGK